MKKSLALCCTLLVVLVSGCAKKVVPRSSAEMQVPLIVASYQGYDVLGLAKYCNKYLQAPKLPAVSTLLNTFGDPLPCIEKRIQQGGLKLVQVDLIDATCWRNHVCPPGVPKPDDLRVIKQRAGLVSVLAEKYPNVDFWISPALEHDVKDIKKVRKMFDAAKAGCPKCKMINSPMSGAKPPEYPVEKHGTKVTAFAVSGDGASSFDGDNIRSDGNNFEHRIAGERQSYAWFNEMNGRVTGEDTFTTPKKRTCWPTEDLFKQAYLIMQPEPPKPNPPPQCKQTRDIEQNKEINKPNAEAYAPCPHPDKRGNRPLLIIKKPGNRGDRMNVLRADGQKVASFCYYGNYPDLAGAHRWYMGDCSGQTPAALYNALGGEWGFAQLGGGKCLRFNAIRRQGTYR